MLRPAAVSLAWSQSSVLIPKDNLFRMVHFGTNKDAQQNHQHVDWSFKYGVYFIPSAGVVDGSPLEAAKPHFTLHISH